MQVIIWTITNVGPAHELISSLKIPDDLNQLDRLLIKFASKLPSTLRGLATSGTRKPVYKKLLVCRA